MTTKFRHTQSSAHQPQEPATAAQFGRAGRRGATVMAGKGSDPPVASHQIRKFVKAF